MTPFTAEHEVFNVDRMHLTYCAGIDDDPNTSIFSLFFVGTLFRTKLFPLLKLMHDVHEDIMLKGKSENC